MKMKTKKKKNRCIDLLELLIPSHILGKLPNNNNLLLQKRKIFVCALT